MGRLLARFLSRVVHNEAMQTEYVSLKKSFHKKTIAE